MCADILSLIIKFPLPVTHHDLTNKLVNLWTKDVCSKG